ncbi:restriction endonuclease subunit S [Candidatus Pelagibacter ubique]|nr:restriction endonuclease subunit S [Candidatus Pelagibacter ubique]
MNKHDICKETNHKWIDKIPKHWKIKRLKYLTKLKKEYTDTGEEELLSVTETRGIVKRKDLRENNETLSSSEDLVGYRLVEPGDLVNNIMLVWKRGLGVSPYKGVVSPAYSVFSFNEECYSWYYNYLLRSEEYIAEFRKNSTGIIMSRLRLYDDSFGSVYAHCPPFKEQKIISCYLDKKTSQIDSLVQKIKKKIKLLIEKKTSLINEVVTKGLNPNMKMKDSGVEWIGEMPSHWEESQSKFYIKLRHGYQFRDSDFTDEGIKIVKITQLDKGGFLNLSNCSTIDEQRLNNFKNIIIHENDILMCLTGGTIGKIIKVGKVGEPLLQNYRVGHFSPIDEENMNDNYMFYLMSSEVIVGQIFYDVKETGQPNIGMEDISKMRICVPPISEQQQIVSYLDEQTQLINKVISIEEKRIKLLKEYHQSLISSAITGKIRISKDMI